MLPWLEELGYPVSDAIYLDEEPRPPMASGRAVQQPAVCLRCSAPPGGSQPRRHGQHQRGREDVEAETLLGHRL